MRHFNINIFRNPQLAMGFMAILILAIFTPRIQAQLLFPSQSQKLFGGIPEPSMGQYANLWEGITGLTWRTQTSTLFLGEQLSDNTFELVAHQVETEPGNGFAAVVGAVEILEQYPYSWLLPYELDYEVDDSPDITHASMSCIFDAASIVITGNNGFISNAVAGVVTMTITATTVDGDETGTVSILVPLGLTEGPVLAGQIAERIATMAIYDGDPIDPNIEPGQRQVEYKAVLPSRPSCSQQCLNSYNTAVTICRNNLRNELHNCGLHAMGGAVTGCVVAGGLCSLVPVIGNAICCVGGGLSGVAVGIYICVSEAQHTFDTCLANADAMYALCMLNNCGIIIAGPGGGG